MAYVTETKQSLQRQIEKLIPKAETGGQWAEICALEARMLAARDEDTIKVDGSSGYWVATFPEWDLGDPIGTSHISADDAIEDLLAYID